MWIDSHCHLDGKRFDEDRQAVIERALAAGVTTMLAIGTGDGPPDLDVAIRLAEQHSFIWASVGVHPHDAAKWTADCAPALRERMSHPRVVALGEIGLDYHYDFSPRDVQQRVFVEQMAIAAEAGKPILIHTREAWDDTFALIEKHWTPMGLPGVMHCFTGGPAEAQRSLALGFTLSFSGVVTYPKAPEVREAALLTPLDRMLVETDAPYLAPVPFRGKRNEPAYVALTGEMLAALLGVPAEELARRTSVNFRRLFPAAASQ
jgi:TatD DNase family protein